MNKKGILLELVQVITDQKLVITKAYISSDCGWFMDGETSSLLLHIPSSIYHLFTHIVLTYYFHLYRLVFNVTTSDGDKITDQVVIDLIKKVSKDPIFCLLIHFVAMSNVKFWFLFAVNRNQSLHLPFHK